MWLVSRSKTFTQFLTLSKCIALETNVPMSDEGLEGLHDPSKEQWLKAQLKSYHLNWEQSSKRFVVDFTKHCFAKSCIKLRCFWKLVWNLSIGVWSPRNKRETNQLRTFRIRNQIVNISELWVSSFCSTRDVRIFEYAVGKSVMSTRKNREREKHKSIHARHVIFFSFPFHAFIACFNWWRQVRMLIHWLSLSWCRSSLHSKFTFGNMTTMMFVSAVLSAFHTVFCPTSATWNGLREWDGWWPRG